MERIERTYPAPSFMTALVASYRRFVANLESGRTPHAVWGADVAFSDALEREMIRRELHAD